MKTLIIQGNCLKECVDWNLSAYSAHFDEIIISTYRTAYTERITAVKVIFNDLDAKSHYNFQSIYLHAGNILSAALESKSEYCLKIRGDEYYSGINLCPMNPTKILTNNVFFSPIIKFHISDHMMGMSRDAMIAICERIRTKCENHEYAMLINEPKFFGGSEEVFFREFLYVMGYSEADSWDILREKYIDMMYIEDMFPFRVAFNSAHTSFYNAASFFSHPLVRDCSWRGTVRKGNTCDDFSKMVMLGVGKYVFPTAKPVHVKLSQFDMLG